MNILCKLFGHRMYFDSGDITGSTHCKRWKCGHREKRKPINWPRMPEIKPPKKYGFYNLSNCVEVDLSIVLEIPPIYELGGGYYEFAIRLNTGLASGVCGKDISKISDERDMAVDAWKEWKSKHPHSNISETALMRH